MAYTHLGELIRERREGLGMTQADLGDVVGTTGAYISQIESGSKKWPRKYIEPLSNALDLSLEEMRAAAGMRTPRLGRPTAVVGDRLRQGSPDPEFVAFMREATEDLRSRSITFETPREREAFDLYSDAMLRTFEHIPPLPSWKNKEDAAARPTREETLSVHPELVGLSNTELIERSIQSMSKVTAMLLDSMVPDWELRLAEDRENTIRLSSEKMIEALSRSDRPDQEQPD